jgi:hypothetical protein
MVMNKLLAELLAAVVVIGTWLVMFSIAIETSTL